MTVAITNFVSRGLENIEAGQPVVLLLHGYGANERDLPDLMSFLPDLPWAALRAPVSLGYDAYAWHHITTALNPSFEDVAPPTDAIWAWVDEFLPADSPLIVLGFSQGALMATQLLRTRPERLAATVILSGFVFGGELPADGSLKASKPKVYYGRGANDPVVTREAIAALNSWLQAHTRAQTKTYEAWATASTHELCKMLPPSSRPSSFAVALQF